MTGIDGRPATVDNGKRVPTVVPSGVRGGEAVEHSVIGVKVADGTCVPVLDTGSASRRRLVLTTVSDSQRSVQIQLFRGADETFADPEYVGSLTIDNIAPAPAREPDVVLLLGMDESGNLNATAQDETSGAYKSLSVSLNQLDESAQDLADFEFSEEELSVDDLSVDDLPSDESVELPGLDDFQDDERGFDASLADAEFDAEPEADEPEADELPLDELSLEELSFEEETDAAASDEAEVLADVETEFDDAGIFEDSEASDDVDAMEVADLGDEDFTFDALADDDSGQPSDLAFDDTLSPEEFDRLDSEPGAAAGRRSPTDEVAPAPRKANAIIFIGYLILALAAIAVITYFVFRLLEGPPAPPLRAAGLTTRAAFLAPLVARRHGR